MNLAEKLANVDMTEDNRISDEDRKYCETHQKAYELAIENLKGLIFYWECAEAEQDDILGDYDKDTRSYNSYLSINDFSINRVNEKIIAVHEKFIRYLVNHFDRTYHIELDVDKIIDFLIPKKPEYEYTDRINYEKRVEAWEKEMENISLKFEDRIKKINALNQKKSIYWDILRQRLDNLDKDYALLKMQTQELIVRNNKTQIQMPLSA